MKGECGKPHPLPEGARLINIYSINPHFKIPGYTNAYVYELRLYKPMATGWRMSREYVNEVLVWQAPPPPPGF